MSRAVADIIKLGKINGFLICGARKRKANTVARNDVATMVRYLRPNTIVHTLLVRESLGVDCSNKSTVHI